jgi:hypothetical protein
MIAEPEGSTLLTTNWTQEHVTLNAQNRPNLGHIRMYQLI